MRDDVPGILAATKETIESLDHVTQSADDLLKDNRASLNSFSNQSLRQTGTILAELRETLRAVKQLANQLGGGSSGLLISREHSKEFAPQ